MIVSINQPAYLPWLGYFNRIARSDIAIVLDDVRLEHGTKTSFTNRNKIRTKSGWTWLTVPVKTTGKGQPLICDVEIDTKQEWAKKQYRSITQSYSRASFFELHREWLETFYNQRWTYLAPMLNESTSYLLGAIGIETPLRLSSQMDVEGEKSQLILNLCKHVGATTYISGPFGRDYLDAQAFADAGIEIEFDDYEHPEYSQLHPGFEPYMSIIDLLFNHGDDSLDILRGNAGHTSA